MALLWSMDWIWRYQVIQKSCSHIQFRIAKAGPGPQPTELEEISARTRLVIHDDVEVTFEFLDDILATNSGKFRFIISEVIP
jgi:phenylacetate-CoA ligase